MLNRKVNNNLNLYKHILNNNGVIACPTDTVYGLFASSLSDSASQKIFQIKKRNLSKKLIVNVANVKILNRYVKINSIESLLIKNFWPGALSIIFNLNSFGNKSISRFVIGNDNSICCRIPNHPQTLELLEIAKIPLISTSVNLSGSNPINDYHDIIKNFQHSVDLIVKNNYINIDNNLPSTIIDARIINNVKILRIGSILPEIIENCIKQKVKIAG